MNILWILGIIVLMISYFIIFNIGIKIGYKNSLNSKQTIFDMKQNYLEVLNEFYIREFTYEIHQRFSNIIHIKGSSNGSSIALQKLGDNEELRVMISGITTNIISKMSNDLKNAFYRLYTIKEDEQTLIDYTTRWVFFKIRSIITKINIEIQKNSEIDDPKLRLSINDITDRLLIELELDVYNSLGIELMTDEETKGDIR